MKVLFVGFGSIARKHYAALKQTCPDLEVFALRSSKDAAIENGIQNVYNFQEIEHLNFDFSIVSSPTFLHESNINDLLQFNKPIFIEKPLSHNLEIEEIVKKVQKENVRTYIACNLRFLDALTYVKDNYTLKIEEINEVNSYCGSYLPAWRPNQDYLKSYSANESLGGGVHLDLIHEIDYLFWLFGKPISSNSFLKRNSTLKINAIDYAHYVLEYTNFTAVVTLNYFRKDAKRTFEIVMNDKTILVDLISNTVFENGNIVFKSDQKIIDTYEKQMDYFINCIRNNEDNFNNIEEAFNILSICI